MDRRNFIALTSAAIGSSLLAAPRSLDAAIAPLEERKLLQLGLNALARAPERSYFADGHRGAALISAHFMCVDNQFDDAAAARIVELFEANWAGSDLCEDYPAADPVADATEQIGRKLAEGNGVLREVGHDAIFAMHAIKAFRLVPEAATPERVAGVCQLIESIKPWRDIPPDPSIEPPPFDDAPAASRFVLREASDAIDRFIGYGQGFAGHMLTFGQSLIELAAMGDVEWAESCRTAFCKYLTVTRQGPDPTDRKIKEHTESTLRPQDTAYWQQRGTQTLGIGHVFKYPYAYYDLLTRANDPELSAELDAKCWRLF